MNNLNTTISFILGFSILYIIMLIISQILGFPIMEYKTISKIIIGIFLIVNGMTLIICMLLSVIKKIKLWNFYSILSIELLILGFILTAIGLVFIIKR